MNYDTVVIGVGSEGQIIDCALRVKPLVCKEADQNGGNEKSRLPEVGGQA